MSNFCSNRSFAFITMLMLAAFAGCVLLAEKVSADIEKPTVKERPLFESPDYSDSRSSRVQFRALDGASFPYNVSAPVETLSVRFRSDGKDYTSLECVNEDVVGACARITILVPKEEDVALWQTEIDNWKKLRQDYLDSLPKPRRVLPKKH